MGESEPVQTGLVIRECMNVTCVVATYHSTLIGPFLYCPSCHNIGSIT